ncbi:MAG: ABC transporter permease [Nitrososphaerales archaeon]
MSTILQNKLVSTLLSRRSSKAGVAIIVAFLLLILIGPFVIPYGPYDTSNSVYAPPSLSHLLGTDYQGKDVLSQLVWGAIPSMVVGVLGAMGAVLIGLLVGSLAGYFTRYEGILTGFTDIVMIFPPVPLMVLLGTIRPASSTDLIIILSVVLWPPIARSIRSQVLSLREMPFIEVAKMSGMRDWEILLKLIVRSVAVIAFAYFVLAVGAAIILVTGLEYIGVGNPDIVSWGSMIYWAQNFGFYAGAWWWILAPGIAISLLTIGFALIGFSIEEALNPRLRTS